jgi:Ca2+-binding RTX toxin-like protein
VIFRLNLSLAMMVVLLLGNLTSASASSNAAVCKGEAVTIFIENGDVPSEGDDVILGTPGRDIINAGAGDDIICGLGDDDSIFGGDGDDTIVGGRGRDVLAGGLGDDTINGGRGEDLLIDGPGSDVLRGGRGFDWCTGGAESQGCESLVSGAIGEGLAPTLEQPLADLRVGSRYGMRFHPILGFERMHAGVDLRADKGDRILAAANGVVIATGKNGGHGKRVIIDHGGGYTTLSAHMWKIRVKEGDVVAAGDVIGRVGSTGLATGPHLHFEVLLGRIRLDPLLFLEQREGIEVANLFSRTSYHRHEHLVASLGLLYAD